MADLPATIATPVIRADFTDDRAWNQIKAQIAEPTPELYEGEVEYVDRPDLTGLDEAALVASFERAYPDRYEHPILFIVDNRTINEAGNPILAVNINGGTDEGTLSFRTVPGKVASIEANLSIANMDFDEFADGAGEDGVFRGFPE